MIIDEATIAKAGDMLAGAAPAGSGVLLFGSRARGSAGVSSDVDFLVVEPAVADQFGEMVRLRDVLRPLGFAADVLVISREAFERWRSVPNNVLYDAAREGRWLHALG